MVLMEEVRTARLRLRPWSEADRRPFAAMHADPDVMAFMPGVLDDHASDALVARNLRNAEQHGFGPWSIEVVGGESFVGYAGLQRPNFFAHFTPCVEIGWMLARHAWGRGYAIEAARAICRRAFNDLGIDELVAFTVPANARSRRVMAALGMSHDEVDDFDHPRLAVGHPLHRHVLYRLSRRRWAELVGVGQG
jgi:RimJ/RimL family protein N-acetyltransferase